MMNKMEKGGGEARKISRPQNKLNPNSRHLARAL